MIPQAIGKRFRTISISSLLIQIKRVQIRKTFCLSNKN